MKKEEIIDWLKKNEKRFNGGYIVAYRNKYEMIHYIDSQFMDLEFGYFNASDNGLGFLAPDGFPASYALDYSDIIKSTKVEENHNYKCKCKYVIRFYLKRRNVFVMYFDLIGEKRMDGDLL